MSRNYSFWNLSLKSLLNTGPVRKDLWNTHNLSATIITVSHCFLCQMVILTTTSALNVETSGYNFTKWLTQNLNLRTHLKLEYNIISLNYIQQNFSFQASFLHCILLCYGVFLYLFDMISGLKVIKIRNECVTLRNGLSDTIIAIYAKWLYI